MMVVASTFVASVWMWESGDIRSKQSFASAEQAMADAAEFFREEMEGSCCALDWEKNNGEWHGEWTSANVVWLGKALRDDDSDPPLFVVREVEAVR